MEINKVRVFRTDMDLYKFGVRQPRCTNKTMAQCPANHLCWDYESFALAIFHARWLGRSLKEQADRRKAKERERIHAERLAWLNSLSPWERAQLGTQKDYALAGPAKS